MGEHLVDTVFGTEGHADGLGTASLLRTFRT